MSGVICQKTGCYNSTNDPSLPTCDRSDCPGRETFRPFSPARQLENIMSAMVRCDRCDNGIENNWNYCAWCGWQLVTDEELPARVGA